MLLLALLLTALDDPAAVKKDADCAAVLLRFRDAFVEQGVQDEAAKAQAASAYYIGKLQGYYATLPPMAFAPITDGELARNAVIAADRKLAKETLEATAQACFKRYEQMLGSL